MPTDPDVAIKGRSFAAAADSRDNVVGWPGADEETVAILRAQADAEDFEDLYLLYRDRVYLYLLRRTGDPDDASDLTQQVFLRTFRSISRYQHAKGPFAGWIFTIARNTHRSFLTRRQPEIAWNVSPEEALASHAVSLGAAPSGLDQIKDVLAKLAPREQELIHLRFEIGLRIPEIAAAVGISNDAAKKALQRSLRKIKDIYDDDHR